VGGWNSWLLEVGRGGGFGGNGGLRYKIGETEREEVEGGGVGVIVESREVAGGHLGGQVGDINQGAVLNTLGTGLT